MNKQKIEILAPGGDKDSVKAAILAGADAVYLGVKKFNARKRATNIDINNLSTLVKIAHAHNCRIYVTMNILLLESELAEALETTSELIATDIDALIVQDLGLATLLRQNFPNLELHASTQMTIHNSLQVDFLHKLGMKQLNFSRELSQQELEPLIEKAHGLNLKSEIFVHGAYCISCSGICYMSSFIAAQPGNRGACLQPCRKQYSLENQDKKIYLLSLKDNNAIEKIEDLKEIKADSLKIEGRIKGSNYVHTVTRGWRQAIDKSQTGENFDLKSIEKDLSTVFNRDFTTGYFDQHISASMMTTSPIDQSLKQIAKVKSYTADTNTLYLNQNTSLKENDRINIYTPENKFICGATIVKKTADDAYQIQIENLLKGKILHDQLIMLLPDNTHLLQLKEKIDELQAPAQEINVEVEGQEGSNLQITFTYLQKELVCKSQTKLAAATGAGLNEELLRKQLGRLGNTAFTLGEIKTTKLAAGLFVPVKELNEMRRQAIVAFSHQKPTFELPTKNKVIPRKKQLAILLSQGSDYQILKDKISATFFAECNTQSQAKHFPQGLNPWLPAFILDKDLRHYENLILETQPDYVISDNSGLGYWCGQNDFNWIAGPQLNSCNSATLNGWQEVGLANGGFISPEINIQQISEIQAAENFKTFFTALGPILLMTSRQCLFQKPGLCLQKKTEKDEKCSYCENYAKIYDERKVPFHLVKNKGQLNRLYNDSFLFLPEAIRQVNSDYFLLDLRDLPFKKFDLQEKIYLIEFFQNLCQNEQPTNTELARCKAILQNITRGNYQRGF